MFSKIQRLEKVTLQQLKSVMSEYLPSTNEEIICLNNMPDEELLNASFRNDLAVDSLDMIVLTMNVEHKFNIVFSEDAVSRIENNGGTVRTLLEEINRLIY